MNKLFLTILTGLFLSTSAFASSITFTPNTATIDEYTNDNTFDISLSVDVDTSIVLFYADGNYAYTCESEGACISDDIIINSYFTTFVLGGVTALSVDNTDPNYSECDSNTLTNCLGSSAYIETIGTPFNFIVAQTANVFSFVDRDISNGSGASTSAILVRGTSNLWPLMLIVVGIPLTFYILNNIISIFRKAQKEKTKKAKRDII